MTDKDIERTSLDAHVSLCELRYQALERRISEVESHLDELRVLMKDIHDRLHRIPLEQSNRWERVQWAVIGGLAGVAGLALMRLLNL